MTDWTEQQLRTIIQSEIERSRAGKELPQNPDGFDIPQFLHGIGWTGRNLRFGTATVAWPGGISKSNNVTITHGMMSAPTTIIAIIIADPAEGAGISTNVRNITGTTFDVFGDYVNGFGPAAPNNRTVHWLAIR